MTQPDATHDPRLRSFVDSANQPDHDFPIQNLPFGVFRLADAEPRVGVAIGDAILDLTEVVERGMLAGLGSLIEQSCRADALNDLMALGPEAWTRLRGRLSAVLGATSDHSAAVALRPVHDVTMELPARVGDYTDFYASIHHATNVGAMFRPENPLLPNYKWVPIGYHGRSSSLVPSETPVRRPLGQLKDDQSDAPRFGPTRALDYECEVGCFIGPGNPQGQPVPIQSAGRHLFGLCLVNDWSARDIQRWEYQPLGPFLSKSFATTVSPWVVTADALAPFRTRAASRPAGDPAPLSYLLDSDDQARGGCDLQLEVWLQSEAMRRAGTPPARVSAANFREMYWTPAQLITHHASNGCNLRPGDLLASGTVSGPTEDSLGCLLELTARGTRPLALPGGETRRFLEDGDEVILRGACRREGAVSIGFGECRGRVIT
jgi:fumarylacetoacetase